MMIFHWLKQRKARKQAAERLYQLTAAQSRNRDFYEKMGVADTFDGRFDILVLHIYLVTERLGETGSEGRALAQALFDAMFRTMDITLREMGVGDMGIPKRMQKMMKAFNGRTHAYHEALKSGNPAALQLAIARNVYRSVGEAVPRGSEDLTGYALALHEYFKHCSYDQFHEAQGIFPEPVLVEEKKVAHA